MLPLIGHASLKENKSRHQGFWVLQVQHPKQIWTTMKAVDLHCEFDVHAGRQSE